MPQLSLEYHPDDIEFVAEIFTDLIRCRTVQTLSDIDVFLDIKMPDRDKYPADHPIWSANTNPIWYTIEIIVGHPKLLHPIIDNWRGQLAREFTAWFEAAVRRFISNFVKNGGMAAEPFETILAAPNEATTHLAWSQQPMSEAS